MSISKRERILIIVVVLLALLGAYYLYYLKPNMDEVSELNSDIENLQLQKSAHDQQTTQAELLKSQIEDMDEQLALYGDSIAHSFDQPPVLVYLSDTINTYASKNLIQFDMTQQTGPIERYVITITMTATYDGLKQVLSALEDSPYLIRISGMSISTDTQITVMGTETDTEETESTDTAAGSDISSDTTNQQVPISSLKSIAVTLTADFYCLAGEIPEDAAYEFDTDRQYGGDIFY